nr:hypothetical protein [Tanacetum cinerariifolium]
MINLEMIITDEKDVLKNTRHLCKRFVSSWCSYWFEIASCLKPVQSKNDKKTNSSQPKPKVLNATHVVNTTTSNSFDALGSMNDVEDAKGVSHFSIIGEKEVNHLEEHGPKPNRVENSSSCRSLIEPNLNKMRFRTNMNTTKTRTACIGSMNDVEDAKGVSHFSIIGEKEVNHLEEHGPKPNRVEVVNKDKRLTVEYGSMHGTSMDLQEGISKSDVEEYENETAQFMAFSYKRHGGGTNDLSLRELDEYHLYDGYGIRINGRTNCIL